MAKLSDNPLGADFEDFVAAHLASRGMFVETGITERDPRDVLELDIVWTDYRDANAPRNAMELKSKSWGLGDYFKFYGWVTYIGITNASFVFRTLPDQTPVALLERLGGRTKIKTLHLADLSKIDEQLAGLGLPNISAAHMPEAWRYTFWAQRRLLLSLSKSIDAKICPISAKLAKDAWKLFNDAVFFEPDVRTRVSLLLKEHLQKRYIASAAAGEIEGKEPVFEVNAVTETFKKALFNGAHFPVQACLYVSHRGRLATLKAAVDYVLAKRAGKLSKNVIKIFGHDVDVSELELHGAFKNAVSHLEIQPTTQRYAVFWQVFLWAWGGFILLDRKAEEYAALSKETGVPEGEIDAALALFDVLFPRTGGASWYYTPKMDSRRVLQLMPPAIRGIGAYNRLLRYGKKEYKELGFADWTGSHMAEDHNAAYRLLGNDDAQLLK